MLMLRERELLQLVEKERQQTVRLDVVTKGVGEGSCNADLSYQSILSVPDECFFFPFTSA